MDAKTFETGADAPLLATADCAFPPGTRAIWYEGVGGLPMRAAFAPAEQPRGSVVLSGGRTEPIEKYVEVVGELVARGFSVLIHDWRGQGRSARLLGDRLKGHAAGYDDFIEDFRRLVAQFDDRLPHPRIAVGHSMGGCLTLTALAKQIGGFDAAILSAPMLGLNTGQIPPWLARSMSKGLAALGRGGGYILGGATDPYTTTFEADQLTHDRARYDRTRRQILADRDLALGAPTWGWLASAFRAVDWLHTAPEVTRIHIPLVVMGAELERLVSNADQRTVTARVPGARYVEVKGAFHEILMETDDIRAQFWREFDALAEQVGAGSKPPG
ncbi:alpha/beta fold hydrolase [Phenylobacterium montanum]|uniref:Alpha/beta hydrolase n=1 Tax=Phenylobacterium montanum TaxID=2823693 RepID=A0A975FY24_9CAUL|nr:alpha/beta hydrolase [Caulobacter sp. S6]QUD86396.1 alpha/beta hydrolase [Caulobacter sp. S6]